MRFQDRIDAGEQLAQSLEHYQGKPLVVYALPRGGVVLGHIVAKYLSAPLDLLIPRKIGHPDNPEYAVASVTELGDVVENKAGVRAIDQGWYKQEIENQRMEAKRRRETYLANRERADVTGKIAIIVDDGIATGLTIKAAITDLKRHNPSHIVVAVPVAPHETITELEQLVDKVVVLEKPLIFLGAIGSYYDSFDQVEDREVIEMMKNNLPV